MAGNEAAAVAANDDELTTARATIAQLQAGLKRANESIDALVAGIRLLATQERAHAAFGEHLARRCGELEQVLRDLRYVDAAGGCIGCGTRRGEACPPACAIEVALRAAPAI